MKSGWNNTTLSMVGGFVLLVAIIALRWLYGRVTSKRHSFHEARLVRFQFFLVIFTVIFAVAALVLVFTYLASPSHH